MPIMADKPKRNRGRPRVRRETVSLQARIDRALSDVLDGVADRNRRPKNTEIIIAIEQYLQSLGLWPPSPP